MEIAVGTGRMADAIADPDKTSTIPDLIAEGGYYGMQTFDQHLVTFVRDAWSRSRPRWRQAARLTVELRRYGLVA